MLSVRNVTKKYGNTLALSDVSLEAAPGQVVLVVGGCGAGKSSLLDCIAGVSAFDGSIAVGDFGCRSFQARRLVSYVRDPLSPASGSGRIVRDKLSCEEHLAFIRRAFALDADAVKYASSLVSSFGLDLYRYRPACELPASALRRLEIVLALASRPSLLLLDRPSLGLDTVYAEELYACLLAMKLRGTAVVIAASDVSEIGAVWDVCYELRGGRLVGTFAPEPADDASDDITHDAEAADVGDQVQPDDGDAGAVDAAADVPTADVPQAEVPSDVPASDDTEEAAGAETAVGEADAAFADTETASGGEVSGNDAAADGDADVAEAEADTAEPDFSDAGVSNEKTEKAEDAV